MLTYSCTHQWRRLFKGERIRKQYGCLCVATHVFRHSTIIMQTFMFRVFAETDIPSIFTSVARKTLVLEENSTHTLPNFEFRGSFGANLHDSPNRLVGWYKGQLGLVNL
jgi:hypothetical protein